MAASVPIIVGPAPHGEPDEDVDGIVLGPPVAPPPERARSGGHQGRPRSETREGTFIAWLVGDPTARPLPETGDAFVPDAPASPEIVGLAMCAWVFVEPSAAEEAEHAALSRVGGRSRAMPAWGFVRYSFLNVHLFDAPRPLPQLDTDLTDPVTAVTLSDLFADVASGPSGRSVRDVLDAHAVLSVTVVSLPWRFLWHAVSWDRPALWRSWRLGARTDFSDHVHAQPPASVVGSWRRKVAIAGQGAPLLRRKRPRAATYEDVVLALPDKRLRSQPSEPRKRTGFMRNRTELDPLHLLRALFFARHLHNTRCFSEAMADAHVYLHPEDERARDSSKDPSRSALDRGMERLDIVDLLLHRREFHADAQFDRIESICLLTDGSPNTGTEIQGMVMDVLRRDGSTETIVLPGCTLLYGMFDAVSKSIALLHALWVIAGPDYATLEYVLRKVICVTTDFGCEVRTLEMVDCVRAYCEWMRGVPWESLRPLVNRDRRWLPNAIRIGGWSHTMGTIMKHTVESWSGWPRKLEQVRHLVAFCRNASWRTYLKKALALNPPDGVDLDTLDHFSEQIAKWRYEAVAAIFSTLTKVFPALKHARQEMFANAKDRAMITGAFDAIGDPELEPFLAATSAEVFEKVEKDRHWGMICTCPEHVARRIAGEKHVACWWNSRRLPEAWTFIKGRMDTYRERARNVPLEACRGNATVCDVTGRYLSKVASLMKQRMGYLKLPPWSFARCGEVEGAREFMEYVRSVAWESHDPVTKDLADRLGFHMDARGRGEDVHPDLQAELKRWKAVCLNEGAGEGYHRSTTLEKKRAPASSIKHLKRAARRKGAFAHIRRFKNRYGKRGTAVIRFEFRHWKRVLNCNPKRRWSNVHRTPKEVYGTVYREDDYAGNNWNNIVNRELPLHHAVTEEPTAQEACRNEYLLASVHEGKHYSIEVTEHAPREDGGVQNISTTLHFHLVNTAHTHHRAHVMPSIATPLDTSSVASLAWEVQYETPVTIEPGEAAVPAGTSKVFADGDTEWVRPSSIASFTDLQDKLKVHHEVRPDPEAGVLVLSDTHRAQPDIPIMSPKCPVLSIIQHCKRRGWRPTSARVVHTTEAIGDFDCQEAIKFREYLQCVASLPSCIPLTPEMPSRQPIAYYRLLLRGMRAVPNESAKTYQLALNTDLRKRGKQVELLPLEDAVGEPLEDDDPDGIVVPGAARIPKAQPKRDQGPRVVRDVPVVEPVCGGGPDPDPPVGMPPTICGRPGSSGGPYHEEPAVIEDGDDPDGIVAGPVGMAPRPPPRRAGAHENKDWKAGLFGSGVIYEEYRKKDDSIYRNYTILCTKHVNPCCVKTKGRYEGNMRRHGELEPLAFLTAWLFCEPKPGKTHANRASDPSDEMVDGIVRENADELQDLFQRLVPS